VPNAVGTLTEDFRSLHPTSNAYTEAVSMDFNPLITQDVVMPAPEVAGKFFTPYRY
jgi:hypothetical protein